jgi:N-acetylglutamate synthase
MPPVAADDPVGRKVVVRRVMSGDGPSFSDVVGVLVEAGPVSLVIRRRDGSLVEIDRGKVAVMKSVPAAPRDVLALEEVARLGWEPVDSRWLGRWFLRAAEGWTGRANSVLPLGEPGPPLDEALAEVTAWYADRGLPARFAVPTPGRELLAGALQARGWTAYNPTGVFTTDVAAALRRWPDRGHAVRIDPVPDDDWLGLYHYRGTTRLPPVARRVLLGAREPGFAVLRAGGVPAAIARGSVDGGWVGVTAVEVDPAHRRQGLGTAVMRAVLAWAADRGATGAYLQVADENTAALALYAGLGFHHHHRYHYRLAPGPSPAPS